MDSRPVTTHPGVLGVERLSPSASVPTLICASCGRTTDTVPCSACGRNPLLEGRYRLEHTLPGDASGMTYAAADLRRAGRPVTVRVVPLSPELADTVTRALPRALAAHRRLRCVGARMWQDAFLIGSGRRRAVGVIQDGAVPITLADAGYPRLPQAEVVERLTALLQTLQLLHSQSPPIPAGSLVGGRVGLDDDRLIVLHPGGLERFGEAPVAGPALPPEARSRVWSRVSDLHQVGVVGVTLLTGRAPEHLVDPSGGWDWERHATVSAPLAALLGRLLASDPETRPATASEVLDDLRLLDSGIDVDQPTLDPPADTLTGAAVRVGLPRATKLRPPPVRPRPVRRDALPGRVEATRVGWATDPAPEQTSLLVQLATITAALVVLVAVVIGLQVAATATGVIDGSPWLEVSRLPGMPR